jgi:hypothetical protein
MVMTKKQIDAFLKANRKESEAAMKIVNENTQLFKKRLKEVLKAL